ncbi:hypothetical protein CABS01_10656 [Colletotrichum abscissum]|nr:uncharacterized protein CABS01_10656 [Colletotrichum abscissum]KAK1498881.1 hypothetical protein CABS01_10656 [Colletotrichum abscissum]
MTVEWRTCLEHCDQVLPTKPMAPVPHREIICSFLSCLSVFCTERPTDRPTAPVLNTRRDGMVWDGKTCAAVRSVEVVFNRVHRVNRFCLVVVTSSHSASSPATRPLPHGRPPNPCSCTTCLCLPSISVVYQ